MSSGNRKRLAREARTDEINVSVGDIVYFFKPSEIMVVEVFFINGDGIFIGLRIAKANWVGLP